MITKTKQSWEIGQTVRVGFLADLLVVAKIPTPGDNAPDAYLLCRKEQAYKFVPHFGIEKISFADAQELATEAKAQAARLAAAAVGRAAVSARFAADLEDLFAE